MARGVLNYFTSWRSSDILAFAFTCLAVFNLWQGASEPLITWFYILMAAAWALAGQHEFRRDQGHARVRPAWRPGTRNA